MSLSSIALVCTGPSEANGSCVCCFLGTIISLTLVPFSAEEPLREGRGGSHPTPTSWPCILPLLQTDLPMSLGSPGPLAHS